jgi:5-methylcytosine-specific restriction endonuclease McrA
MALKAKAMREISPVFWAVALRDRGKCVYCGLDGSKDIRILRNLHLDHLIPRSAKGTDDVENRVLSCSYCNRDCKRSWDPSKGAAKLTEREALLKRARKYVRTQQGSQFFTELFDKLHSK